MLPNNNMLAFFKNIWYIIASFLLLFLYRLFTQAERKGNNNEMPDAPNLKKFFGPAVEIDAGLSITARRILRYEAHTSSECIEAVWKPIQDFLEALAKQKPKYIICARSTPFSPNENDELCIDVDILGFDGKTAYLGMVANTKQALYVWTKYAKNCLEKALICAGALHDYKMQEEFNEHMAGLKKLLEIGPLAIIRENIGWFIPVVTEDLSRRSVERGVKKMLSAIAPALAGLPIRWLPHAMQNDLERFIEGEALRSANRPTAETREEVYRKDVT